MSDFVQPIMLLVPKNSEPAKEVDAITAVAAASVDAYRNASKKDAAAWEEWLSDAFTKSVRRADEKAFERVLADLGDLKPVMSMVGRARAAAFAPVLATEMPKPLAKLQVSGTSLPAGPSSAPQIARRPVIYLNLGLDMTTGKAAAQAAHANFAWHLRHGFGLPSLPKIMFASTSGMDRLALAPGAVVIRDAGRTEIAPNSLTAIAVVE